MYLPTTLTKFETEENEQLEIMAWDDGDVAFTGTAGLFTLDEIKRIIAALQRHVDAHESKEK